MAETMTRHLLPEPVELALHLRRSPLAGLAGVPANADVRGDRAVAVREVPFLTMVSVRAEPRSAAAVAIGEVLDGPLPDRTGETSTSTTTSGEHTTLRLPPDEWLVLSNAPAAALVARPSVALGHVGGDIVDVSANRTRIELAGPSARAMLEKGCPADLHPPTFPCRERGDHPGPGPAAAVEHRRGSWRLLLRSSFGDNVARWLVDAMTELSLPEVP